MKNLKLEIFLFTIVVGLVSCTRSELKPSELIEWVENEENGLRQSREFREFGFEATLKPTDYIIAIEGRTDELTNARYLELKSQIGDLQYVDLKIKTVDTGNSMLESGIQDQDEYYARLDYFVTSANQDISLIQGQDTLAPCLYHFERNYGLAPYNTILLGFENQRQNGDVVLLIEDQILGVGRVKFVFDGDDINTIPTLKRS